MDIKGQLDIWDLLSSEAPQSDVKVNGALNVHSKGKIEPFEVTLTTGDLVLIVSMIEDYIKGLDVIRADDIQWTVYYHKKFKGISEKIQRQIEYDYAKAVEKCRKNAAKESNSDIGDEAMSLMIKKAEREAKAKETNDAEQKDD